MADDAHAKQTIGEFQTTLDVMRADLINQTEAGRSRHFPKVVYHYTPAATLTAILRSREIWATDGLFLNDGSELRHAARVAADLLRELPISPERFKDGLVRALDNDHKAILTRRSTIFVASFSKAGDSLSQWRAYADNGAGLALGFDLNSWREQETPIAPGLSKPVVAKCMYGRQRQRDVLAECIFPQLHKATEFWERIEPQQVLIATARSVLVTTALLGHIMKNPGFREEREWRLLVHQVDKKAPDAVDFRNTQFGLAAYVRVPLAGSDGTLPLRRVVLGPRTDPAVARTVRAVLERFECDAEVDRSEVTYR